MSTETDIDSHVYCRRCPRYIDRDIAEQSDLWEYTDGEWECEYCTLYQ